MILIELNRMPKNCEECAFCLKINKLAVYCMATRFQIKYDETDLRDGMCPIHDLELAPVVHGHWIEELGDVISCRCSRCDHSYNLYEDDINGYPYCAWCGAKMDESEESGNE